MQNIKAVILDIDGTLAKYNSWVTLTEKLGADVSLLLQYLKDLRKGIITLEEANSAVVQLWVETGKASKENILKIYEETEFNSDVDSIHKYLSSKYKLCLISGTTDLYVQTIAKRLNIRDYYWNTKMSFNDLGYLKKINYITDQSNLKMEQFTEWANKNSLKMEECAIIGDGDSDKLLLEKLGLPILIISKYTDDQLKKDVKLQISSISEIKSIL